MSSFAPPSHDEFVVVRRDDRFGGFEEVKHKNENYLVSVGHDGSHVECLSSLFNTIVGLKHEVLSEIYQAQ